MGSALVLKYLKTLHGDASAASATSSISEWESRRERGRDGHAAYAEHRDAGDRGIGAHSEIDSSASQLRRLSRVAKRVAVAVVVIAQIP
jgi:hypothetical protein